MRKWLMFLMFGILIGALSASGQMGKPEAPKGDNGKAEAAKPGGPLDPKTADIWKGDKPTAEQIAKMSQEELKERVCMKQIETLRGLQFKELVKSKALSREQFGRAYGGGGGMNMPMGFYRYNDRTLYVNLGSDAKKLESIRIHESVHALQHQLWGLEEPTTKEEVHMFRSVKEGEATAVAWTLNENMRKFMINFKPGWYKNRQDLEQYTTGKAIQQEHATFDYAVAAKFVDELVAKEGWPAVDKLFKEKPVLSTEMVLHPEKYLDKDKWDEPTYLKFPDLAKAMGPKWKYKMERGKDMPYNTFGEFEMKLLFLNSEDTGPVADEIAAGWDGDWHVALDGGKEGCEIFLTAWDSNKDAVEWVDAYTKLFTKLVLPGYTDKPELKKADTPKAIKPALEKLGKGKSEVRYFTYEGGQVYFEINGNFAIFVECSGLDTLQTLLETIAKDATIKEKK